MFDKGVLHDKVAGREWEDDGVGEENKQVRVQVGDVHDKMQAGSGE